MSVCLDFFGLSRRKFRQNPKSVGNNKTQMTDPLNARKTKLQFSLQIIGEVREVLSHSYFK